jgi:predicted histidine transporter YuiF (NhaC family)
MPKPTICESDAFSKVNILDVAPAMILLVIGMALSLLVLVLEYCCYWRKKNRYTSTKTQLGLQIKNNISPNHKLPVTFADCNIKYFTPLCRKK